MTIVYNKIIIDQISCVKMIQTFQAISWNCECFAWTCATHGVNRNSDEAAKLFLAVLTDLSRGEKSVVLQAVAIGYGNERGRSVGDGSGSEREGDNRIMRP
jgi:hypothetical protein